MTIVICFNETKPHWLLDSRLPHKACWFPDTPLGSYWAIAAAYTGEPLTAVYLQQASQELPSLADPHWMGVLPLLGVKLSPTFDPRSKITDYPELLSPRAALLKLVASEYINASILSDFNLEAFRANSAKDYGLQISQVDLGIGYAQTLMKESQEQGIDSQRCLDNIYDQLQIPTKHIISPETCNIQELFGA
jgi:hypothetical protein